MVLLSMEGRRVRDIASITHRHPQTVLLWLRRWNEGALEGLTEGTSPGRPPKLDRHSRERMFEFVRESVRRGRRLTCGQIASWVAEHLDTIISEEGVRRILHDHDVKWTSSES